MKIFLRRIQTPLLVLLILTEIALSQSTFYSIDEIQKVEIHFSQSNWDYQMDTAKIGSDGYITADWVKINGSIFESVGVKYKGNSSYDSAYIKNPIHIALDEFVSQSYQGYTDIKLSNAHADPSMIRETLSYSILSDYMKCPKANFAQVYINDQYIGLYSNVESINKEFCSDRFFSSVGVLIKGNPKNPGPYNRSNLKWISGDSADYANLYEIKSTQGWSELVQLCNKVSNYPDAIDSLIDIDKVLWMLAFNNVLVNLDSYSGAFAQNYYLYKDKHNVYNPVVWDLNMSFGGFPFAGLQGGGMGTLSIANMQNLPVSLHFSDADWPMIKNIVSNPLYKRMYHAHLRTIVNEFFSNQHYSDFAQQLQSIIDTAVYSDVNKFFTNEQFLGGLTSNVQFGSYIIPGISVLMDTRVGFLENTVEFSYTAPTINSVAPDNLNPEINSIVYITAHITEADNNAVCLGYRFSNADNFIKVPMLDDGLHNDGTANDGVFGASFLMQSLEADYYIYAENSLAGKFSPQRAEHEFYTLKANIVTALPGEIMINEFLAINQTDTVDEDGQHEDWIELYNTTDAPIDLFGLYLTDNFSNPMKFAFPQNSIIQPKGYFIIWADEDNSTASWLHCNFKLSGSGEEIMLSDLEGNILDSLSYGPQTADVSVGRCPDGSGAMAAMQATTFNSANCVSGLQPVLSRQSGLIMYPNPVNNSLHLFNDSGMHEIQVTITSVSGMVVYQGLVKNNMMVNSSDWAAGVYAVLANGYFVSKLIVYH
jgi:hypothetical protein